MREAKNNQGKDVKQVGRGGRSPGTFGNDYMEGKKQTRKKRRQTGKGVSWHDSRLRKDLRALFS